LPSVILTPLSPSLPPSLPQDLASLSYSMWEMDVSLPSVDIQPAKKRGQRGGRGTKKKEEKQGKTRGREGGKGKGSDS